ncbi:MAG: SAM-dependent methyltransferase [Bacteroidetes bacterium]|nr:SAM-dependent methyltransferase [Bacteroidota bacterium]
MNKLDTIFRSLGINTGNGLYYTNDAKWKTLQFPNRIVRLLENRIKPDAFFCIDNKPLILFFENPTDTDLHKKIWNFNETPIVIISKNDAVEIFNGFKYEKDLKELAKIDSNKLTDFTYFNLFTDRTWENYQEHFKYENRLDYFLLHNIKAARNILKKQIEPKIANALIGKCIFVRYLIDRKVLLSFDEKPKRWTNDEFCKLLKNPTETKRFFGYLKVKFNGDDIFALSNDEYANVTSNVLNVLIDLLQGNDLEQGIASLFNFYDFSIIPIEFISNVYELFIGKEDQEDKGAYYTPLFLVDYILKETVEKYFENNSKSDSCVTLDPACGSGIFLVETLRKIIEQYQKNNKNQELTADILKKLASKNIYGIDKDPNAIQVAMFSIYLTLLDYQDPADIEKFKFPPLLNSNFFEADFFNTKPDLFETKLQSVDFDFIIGNPPWKGGALGKYGEKYIEERRKKEKNEKKKYPIAVNNGEIVEGFVLRVSDFSKPKTKCALIVRSSILYNLGRQTDFSKFRRYWLEEFFVNKIVELAPVRYEVFEKSNDPAIAPAAILFYQYANGRNTDDTTLQHIAIKPTRFFSYFKIFTINKPDIKKVEQSLLKKYDWLLKTLVYGSYLDFNLIRRLKENYLSMKDIISDNSKFIYGTGIHYSTKELEKPKNTQDIKDFSLISSYAVDAYSIDYENQKDLKQNNVDNTGAKELYYAPMLLVREGIDTKLLNAKAAVSQKNILFKSSITSVISVDKEHNDLKTMLGFLLSDLYSYLAINTFASIGIEREKAEIYDKFSVPYVTCEIVKLVEFIENAKAEQYNLKQQAQFDSIKNSKIQKEIDNAQKEINTEILKALNFNEIEKSLLDYALNINRPLITRPRTQKNKYEVLSKLQKALSKQEIIDYANVYLNRFKRNIDNNERKFVVRVWHTNQLLGMFFEVVPTDTPDENGIVWENVTDKQILSLIIQLSSEKITDRLFIQKDIRGFEKDRFYIFKPNEKRLWHKAIAYLDAEEFMDAILRAGRRGE